MNKTIFTLLLVVCFVFGASSALAQNLSILIDDREVSETETNALIEAFSEKHPNISFDIEIRPSGADGDNVVKTRLATGDMANIFFYNSGSLVQALNPSKTIFDLTGQAALDNVVESFIPTVSNADGIYAVPYGTGMGGGILYNKAVYADLELEIPLTWDDFVANNAAITTAGITPVAATFADSWTAQLFVLADNYNVNQISPDYADMYSANELKIADSEVGMVGFERLQQGHDLGWWQETASTDPYPKGLELLATGQAAHYPMLTFALPTIAENFPEAIDDIGFFAQPGDSANSNGATIWMPAGAFISKTTEGDELEAALEFLAFMASIEGTEVLAAASAPNGPYLVKGATLPDTVLPAVNDLQAYISAGNSYPALEFISPVKGPNLPQITVAVATGQMTALEGAENYDIDIERQARQLGLPGW